MKYWWEKVSVCSRFHVRHGRATSSEEKEVNKVINGTKNEIRRLLKDGSSSGQIMGKFNIGSRTVMHVII